MGASAGQWGRLVLLPGPLPLRCAWLVFSGELAVAPGAIVLAGSVGLAVVLVVVLAGGREPAGMVALDIGGAAESPGRCGVIGPAGVVWADAPDASSNAAEIRTGLRMVNLIERRVIGYPERTDAPAVPCRSG